MQTDRELRANASRWRLVVGMMVMNLRLQRPGQLRAQMPVCGMWQVITGGESSWEEQGALVPLAEWDGVVAAAGEQSGAPKQEPWQVVRISEWLERLRVIHMGALAALAEAVGTDRLHRIIGPAIGADLVSAGMLSRYEELGPTDEDGESFIVYELTEAGAAAGLAWGKAMRHGRSNDQVEAQSPEKNHEY